MEDAFYSMKQSQTTIYSDRTMRMATRPTIPDSIKPMGIAFEDLRSGFGQGPKSSQSRRFGGRVEPTSSQESNRNGKNGLKAKSPTGSNADNPLTVEDGPDECDFLSQKSDDEGSDSGLGTTSSKKGKGKEVERSDGVIVEGEFHLFMDGYKPKTFPKFKKKTNTQGGSSKISQVVPSASSSTNGTPTNRIPAPQTDSGGLHQPFKPPSRTDSSTNGTPSPQSRQYSTPRANKQLGMLRQYNLPVAARKENRTTPLGERSANTRQIPPRARSPTILVESSEEEKLTEKTPHSKGRPKPRPLNKGSTGPTTRSSSKVNSGPKLDPNLANGSSLYLPSPQPNKEAEEARAPRPFPMDFGEGIKTAAQVVKGKGKEKETVALAPFPDIPSLSSKESPLRRLAARIASSTFPLQPPKSSPSAPPSSQATHPKTSPSPSPRKVKKPKGRLGKKKATTVVHRIVSSSSEQGSSEDEKPAVRTKVPTLEYAAFPMESQMLQKFRYSKRASEGSDVELEGTLRNNKRRKSANEPMLDDILHLDEDEYDEDELRFMDPDVDPSTLCPWCDEPLPPIPSPHLNNLIASARNLSTPDPRPSNPFGLEAIVTVFVLVCQRHSFESIQVPLAERNGWPTSIEWRMVGERVKRLRRELQAIVDDVDEEFSGGRVRRNSEEDYLGVREDEERQKLRPRKGSTFWRDVVQNIKKQGSRQTAGLRGQMSSFNKTQPGYYGELGYVIINQTIYDLFPPESFPTDSTLPLTPIEFIQLVLVPEAAVALIMQDLSQSRQEAIETLRQSAEYGVAMFPDDHGHAANEAGEDIVRKRARERRKLIESEEEEEAGGNVEVDEVTTEPDWDRIGDSEEELWSQLGPFHLPPSSFEIRASETRKDQDVELSDSGMSMRSTRSMTRRKANEKGKEVQGPKQDVEVITVSDDGGESCSSVGRKVAPLRKKRTTKPRKPKPDLSGSQIDLCDTTDTGETSDEPGLLQPPVTPRPKKFASKENTIETSVVAPLSSSQVASVEVQFRLNGKHKVLDHRPSQASIQDLEIDGTPRAKIPGSRSVPGGISRVAGIVPKSKVVRSNTLRIEQPRGQSSQWVYDMLPVDDVVPG